MNIKERSEFGRITLADLLKAFDGIPLETEVIVSNSDNYGAEYNIQGVYCEDNKLVELEIGVWRDE